MTYEPRPGEVILIIVPNYWGKGKTYDAAKLALRKAGGLLRRNGKPQPLAVYSAHPESYLNEMGYIVRPRGARPPQLLSKG